MYCKAVLVKKRKCFQRAFFTKEGTIYITDTARAKRKFLKSGIKNVIFSEDIQNDSVFAPHVKRVSAYDRSFAASFAENMLVELARFLKISFPVDEIGVLSDMEIARMCTRYAKCVTVTCGDKNVIFNGVQIRVVKRLKKPPDIIVSEGEGVSPVLGVPEVNFGEGGVTGSAAIGIDTVAFETDLFEHTIGMRELMFFMAEGEKPVYRVVSMRKKSPRLFTFG